MIFWLVVSTRKSIKLVSWNDEIPNIWESHKNSSKPPSSFCLTIVMAGAHDSPGASRESEGENHPILCSG